MGTERRDGDELRRRLEDQLRASIVANATGFKVRSRGMSRGLQYTGDVLKIGEIYDLEELRKLGGAID